jgi:hypothetical protein
VIDRYLDITPATAAYSEAQVRMTFDAVAKRLSDGRPYLCGDRFTAAVPPLGGGAAGFGADVPLVICRRPPT